MVTQQRQAELDPLWLAVFFMVMALALDNRPTLPTGPDHPFHGYTHQRLDDLARKYHSVSMKALYLGDCMSTPQVRTIQYEIHPYDHPQAIIRHTNLVSGQSSCSIPFFSYQVPGERPT